MKAWRTASKTLRLAAQIPLGTDLPTVNECNCDFSTVTHFAGFKRREVESAGGMVVLGDFATCLVDYYGSLCPPQSGLPTSLTCSNTFQIAVRTQSCLRR